MSKTPAPVHMVGRIVEILNAFKGPQSVLSLNELVKQTGMPKSSIHRILQQLIESDWISREDVGYRLGLGLFEMGALFGYRSQLIAAARPHLRDLSGGRHIVHLAVLDSREVVYLDKMVGVLEKQLPSRIGGRLPAHGTGVGKAILAHAKYEALEAYLEEELLSLTPATITDPDEVRKELLRVRADGVAFDRGESVPGIICVAAPIFEQGIVQAAVSVSASEATGNVDAMRSRVQAGALGISRRLERATSNRSAP